MIIFSVYCFVFILFLVEVEGGSVMEKQQVLTLYIYYAISYQVYFILLKKNTFYLQYLIKPDGDVQKQSETKYYCFSCFYEKNFKLKHFFLAGYTTISIKTSKSHQFTSHQ